MASEQKRCGSADTAAAGGTLWIIGWLFTIGFCGLSFPKALLGLIIWPYLLGAALR